MSDQCKEGCASENPPIDPRYKRILWIALVVNGAMAVIELAGGLKADSVSLIADAIDFIGDAANYAVSLFVLALAPVWRARTALIKGMTMGGYGLFVLGFAGWNLYRGAVPEPATMGLIGAMALIANVSIAVLLYAYRAGDANMRSVWLCTRNDALGNVAILLAAVGVFGSGSGWPDIVVAVVMGVLGLTAATTVIKQARAEIAVA